MGQHLVGMVGKAGRSTVTGNRTPNIGTSRCPDYARTVGNTDYEDFLPVDLSQLNRDRERRLGGVRDKSLQAKGVSSASLVPGTGTCHRAAVLHTNQENSPTTVGEANHRLYQITVIEPPVLLTLELDVVLLTRRHPA
nr:hypothetical protein [Plantactinospora sp. KBS50]